MFEMSTNVRMSPKNTGADTGHDASGNGSFQERDTTTVAPFVVDSGPQIVSDLSAARPSALENEHLPTTNDQLGSLSEKKRAAVPFVAIAPSHAAAARKVGVTPTTVRRWLEEPEFRKAVEMEREKTLEGYKTEFEDMREKGLEVIWKSMESRNEAMRLRAARLVLEYYR